MPLRGFGDAKLIKGTSRRKPAAGVRVSRLGEKALVWEINLCIHAPEIEIDVNRNRFASDHAQNTVAIQGIDEADKTALARRGMACTGLACAWWPPQGQSHGFASSRHWPTPRRVNGNGRQSANRKEPCGVGRWQVFRQFLIRNPLLLFGPATRAILPCIRMEFLAALVFCTSLVYPSIKTGAEEA